MAGQAKKGGAMIFITRLNGRSAVINSALIETVEANPDTTITMTTGRKIIVKEAVGEIIDRVVEFNRKIKI
jgi:flagellar protein FlbD